MKIASDSKIVASASGKGNFQSFCSSTIHRTSVERTNELDLKCISSLAIWVTLAYLGLYVILYFSYGKVDLFSFNNIFAFLIIGAIFLIKKPRRILSAWLPFFILFLAYEVLRGLADNLAKNANYFFPINFENAVFGEILSSSFQVYAHSLSTPTLQLINSIAIFIYSLHFIAPILFALFLWRKNKQHFTQFAIALILISYLALATFIIFPVAPPWMASEKGIIPEIEHIIFKQSGDSVGKVSALFNPNPVAAIPSLHSAYPLLISLFVVKFYGKKYSAIFLFPLLMALSLIYLGEHYVLDILAGFAYVLFVFLITPKVVSFIQIRHKKSDSGNVSETN